ncbi:SOS response-associated peptidase [Ancylobacter sp. 6x-1]|uniref:Abasic site processing protein n=1 Tax=Ancylobacter crimeensis TaxID=2579147 RepID=A0ABT0D8F1_9HYPH|nr:SOS response-associated peptidase [Ancylobacter crimeensis]
MQITPADELARHYGIEGPLPNAPAQYNAPPSARLMVVRRDPRDGRRDLSPLRWGLVPHGAGDPKIGNRLTLARAESVATTPSFREAFARRRCLVPVDAFFEWKAETTPRQPYAVARRDRGPFGLAALWENWRDPASGNWMRTFAVLTHAARAPMAAIHHRMPVIVPADRQPLWLGEEAADVAALGALLAPAETDALELWKVHPRMNAARVDDAGILERWDEGTDAISARPADLFAG